MARREAPVLDAPVDKAAAFAKVLAEAHAKGAHSIPLAKCEACRAEPDFNSKRDAALVVHEPAVIGSQPGRKVKVSAPPPENPKRVSPRRQPVAPPPPVAPTPKAPADPKYIDLDAEIAEFDPAAVPASRSRRRTTSTAGEQVDDVPVIAPPVPDEVAVPPVVEQAAPVEIVEIAPPVEKRVNTTAKGKPKTREEWLLRAVDMLRPEFKAADLPIGDVRVSIGWMGGRGSKKNVIGQCWMPFSVEDKVPAIFLIPTLKDPVKILDVLVHEMVHAGGCPGHRGKFAKVAAAVGLMPPWPSTSASNPLKEKLAKIAEKLGPFPHAVINPGHGLGGDGPERPPVQGTRMLKLSCPEDGYTVRTTAKWIAVGLPSCPDGHEMEREDS